MSKEISLLIIGAVISVISTMIGLFSQLFVQSFLKNKGKAKIYLKKVYSKTDSKPWGFRNYTGGMIFIVPLWIEFHNTKEKKEIIRNLNLQLFANGKRTTNMIQASHYEKGEKKESYANSGSYSFILEPTSISKYDLQFMIKKSDVEVDFDEVKLSYYDSKDKYHEVLILKIEEPWKVSEQSIDKDWIPLK
ncbi:hypothetical protein [Brochothrix thermosphacta]|uniref:hypothetical protein n=1 Tax=Brochothrix thermosphacta TaxID=2756 RepID=UPI000EEA42FA|nr:hypothetical protein [Brochothrix thermosphacta]HCZ38679.1 hypothetical protein [Brochothrix thermosphacta]HCZ45361.1 hypothetical protein [Brochothrix thermosphacta]